MLETGISKSKKTLQRKSAEAPKSTMDHSVHLKRLHRVQGQIQGIERMILDKRYCPDIIAQLRAATAALKAVEAEVFKTHLRGCVKSAFNSNDAFDSEEKIQEIMKMVY